MPLGAADLTGPFVIDMADRTLPVLRIGSELWDLQAERNRLESLALEVIHFQSPRLGKRRLRALLRQRMPMTSRMWKNRWRRATFTIQVGPAFQSRRQELVEQLAEIDAALAHVPTLGESGYATHLLENTHERR